MLSGSEETTRPKAPISVVGSMTSIAVTTSTSTSSTFVSSPTAAASGAISGGCDGFPDTKDILVVMKTGATEAYDKLPIHFMTTLRCVNDSILFSDTEMDMAGHKVIDTLDEVAEDIKKDNGDFDLYRLLQEYQKLHEDPRPLKEGANGWNLDKYKFVHMLLKTYKYRPDVPWYVFIEADTGVIWDNMRTFLNKYDPKRPYYLGSPTYLDIEFAHGGTGYIISQAAMAAAVGKHPDIATKYDKDVQGICCGDRMIGRILLDEDIKLTKAWPMLNGEKPITLPFSKRQWCQPVVTMHHMTAQEVSQVWNFEQERKTQGITVRPLSPPPIPSLVSPIKLTPFLPTDPSPLHGHLQPLRQAIPPPHPHRLDQPLRQRHLPPSHFRRPPAYLQRPDLGRARPRRALLPRIGRQLQESLRRRRQLLPVATPRPGVRAAPQHPHRREQARDAVDVGQRLEDGQDREVPGRDGGV